jgi:hypothetical protein
MKEKFVSFAQKIRGIARWLLKPADLLLKEAVQFEPADKPVHNYEMLLFRINLWVVSLTFFFIKTSSVFLPRRGLPFLSTLYLAAWVIEILTFPIFVLNVLISPRVSVHRFTFILLNLMYFIMLISLKPY